MDFSEAVKSVYSNYAKFDGRSRRSEYWYFTLFTVLVYIAVLILAQFMGRTAMILLYAFALASLIPGIAVTVRRLHDTDRSGWWILIDLIPLIGAIILIVFLVQEGTGGDNSYGQSPKGVAAPPPPPPPAPPAPPVAPPPPGL